MAGEGDTLEPLPEPDPPRRARDLAGGEVICSRCGYDLRGLSAAGTCPECGTPVERSLHGLIPWQLCVVALRYDRARLCTATGRGGDFVA
ncbi:MAG: hypothetical protein ACYS0G_07980 [Planctomycetota bacterium]|jgi:predicted amidophosphoribosyltransferase